MNEGPGTTPSSAFRRALYRPGCDLAPCSETTFDDLPLPDPGTEDEPSLDAPEPEPPASTPSTWLLGGTAVAGTLALAAAAVVVVLAAAMVASEPHTAMAMLGGAP